jgi:hypothetical protein
VEEAGVSVAGAKPTDRGMLADPDALDHREAQNAGLKLVPESSLLRREDPHILRRIQKANRFLRPKQA